MKDLQKANTTPTIIAIIVLVVLVGGVIYFNSQPESEIMQDMGEDMMNEGEDMMKDGEKMMEEGKEMMEDGEAMEKDSDVMMEDDSHDDSMMEEEVQWKKILNKSIWN